MLSPVFTGAFYVGLAVAALLLITALIVLFVNVDVEKMLLPPDMKALRDASGAVTEYSLDLGNGIRIVSPASAVTLSHIKTVIYSSIAAWLLLLLVACPVFRFLSVLLRNVGRKEALNEENARMINYIGLVILIGNTLIVALNNLLNYIQINKSSLCPSIGSSTPSASSGRASLWACSSLPSAQSTATPAAWPRTKRKRSPPPSRG